jgi:hypothetical protein
MTVTTGPDLRIGATVELRPTPADGDLLATLSRAAELLRPTGEARLVAVRGAESGSAGPVHRVEATPVRARMEAEGLRLHHAVRLADEHDATVGEATLVWSAPGVTAAPPAAVADIGTVAWGAALAEALGRDKEFGSSVSTFDGTIGMAAGEDRVAFRIYRGAIIETARKSLDGNTFELTADELTWVRLLLGEHDDYVRLAARGRFRVLGSGFQYLRMTRTVRLMVSAARALARDAAGAADAHQR